jgi:hypothetical protein
VERWLRIDMCLDRGGRWDYAAHVCEFAEDALQDANRRTVTEPSASPGVNCTGLTSPRARAECAALDTVAKVTGLPSRVQEIVASERGYCIITTPATPVLDGAGVVEADTSGVVRAVAVTDSAACPVAAEPRTVAGARPGT